MGEILGKLLLAWFGSPVRGLGAAMIATLIVVGLHALGVFGSLTKDPFWRWPTLVLIACSAGLATYPLEHGWKLWKAKRSERKLTARLKDLTPHEKKVLGRYLLEETTALPWGRGGGAVDVLARDGILHLLTAVPLMPTLTPITERNAEALYQDLYAIDPVVWKRLRAHPELVDLEATKRSG